MKLNFTAPRQITARLIPQMCDNSWGRVIAIGGGHGPAKAALQRYMINIAWEVSASGLTVNCVKPGRIMSEAVERHDSAEVRASQSAREIAVGHYGDPEDMAHMVCYLCSPLAKYITGSVVSVDGGLMLRPSHIPPGLGDRTPGTASS